MNKTIAVIGAGLSGIAAVKQLTDGGHQVTCFEKAESFGGVFADKKIYDDLHLTISNYFMAYSDYVPNHQKLKFWSKKEYINYLGEYIARFDIAKHIHYDHEVCSVQKQGEKWLVTYKSDDEEQTKEFDMVAVCSGHFQKPKLPELPGLDMYRGEIEHSNDYRDKHKYAGKRVLCVGLGESSADITSEISQVARKCILSLRRYPAVAPRYMAFQEDPYFTIDTSWLTSRIVNKLPHKYHGGITKGIFNKYVNSRNDHVRIRGEWLKKSGPSHYQAVTKNERLFRPIADGKVMPNIGGIERFEKDAVVFKDGSREEIDAVVFCTGYQLSFPFLDVSISNMRDLYKQMFIPEMGHSLSFIGFVRPQQGGIPVIAEMQCRYLSKLAKGEAKLPTLSEMHDVVKHDTKHWQKEYKITPHVASLVNYCHYMDSMAKLVGCMPQIPSLFKDPLLRVKLLHNPQFAAQYRLDGPNNMTHTAREFLLSFPNISSWPRIIHFELALGAQKLLSRLRLDGLREISK
ncbi:NAD(P)-binding domain-containing protein [Pseudoalteromonas umbrosa]|uniref:NAD(P)-binding domain-containing protein n=1 Tax=Pseudoalteromonas umbrosa TaxID=3048489 RepID=UPI0024C25363|nr:NAD(P)-binding domain-containing protein [Pseudoalteromonas sp. B95]MDK1286001.1 NAD(P)-binding domain-containing protein [Pseudoalteromonas sp. B95]